MTSEKMLFSLIVVVNVNISVSLLSCPSVPFFVNFKSPYLTTHYWYYIRVLLRKFKTAWVMEIHHCNLTLKTSSVFLSSLNLMGIPHSLTLPPNEIVRCVSYRMYKINATNNKPTADVLWVQIQEKCLTRRLPWKVCGGH